MDELEEDKRNQQFIKDLGFDGLALNEVSMKLKDDVQKARDDKKNIEEINNNVNSITSLMCFFLLAIVFFLKK